MLMAGTRKRRTQDEPVVRLLEKVGRETRRQARAMAAKDFASFLAARPPDPHTDPQGAWSKFEDLVAACLDKKIPQGLLDTAYHSILPGRMLVASPHSARRSKSTATNSFGMCTYKATRLISTIS